MRIGLIGCGNIGVNAHIPAVQANEGMTIVAAADPTPERLQAAAAAAGLGADDLYADWRELLARDDIETFAKTTIGRITTSMVTTTKDALLAVPTGYKHSVKGCHYEATAIDDSTVRLVLVDLPGAWGYQIGQLEGIAMRWGGSPTLRCTQLDPRRREIVVSF